jgi:hypothetical protein
MSFANLKRDRGQINKLVAAAEAVGGGASSNKYTADRLWKPTVDKQNNGYAIIRFLPATEGAELPWIRFWDHGFKGPTGKWYIEKSLTSIGQEDPVGELNSRLWNSGIEADKETARAQKRRLHHVSNILVVSDPGNPANEGKVFLYNYGKKIFDKLMDAMQPEFADEEPINPFDFWNGANFKLKIRDVEGYRNYDKSEFASQEALSEDDDKLESIYNSMHDLNVYAKDGYKSYAELKTKLMSVLGEAAVGGAPSVAQERSLGEERSAPPIKSAPAPEMSAVASSDDDDDIMSHFANLVND